MPVGARVRPHLGRYVTASPGTHKHRTMLLLRPVGRPGDNAALLISGSLGAEGASWSGSPDRGDMPFGHGVRRGKGPETSDVRSRGADR
jgi:hypothetical protein